MLQSAIDNLITASMIIAQILIVLYIVTLLQKNNPNKAKLFKVLETNGFVLAFLVALGSIIGSLYYSEIRDFEPCKFCWLQRIFIYPQAILLGVALWRKDYNIRLYALILTSIGLLIAINQYILQLTGTSFIPCSATAEISSCSTIWVEYLGYITIPFMGLVSFTLLLVSLLSFKPEQID